MERLLKELVQIEKKRNSLLAKMNENLYMIANRESQENQFHKCDDMEQIKNNVGTSVECAIDSAIHGTGEAIQS